MLWGPHTSLNVSKSSSISTPKASCTHPPQPHTATHRDRGSFSRGGGSPSTRSRLVFNINALGWGLGAGLYGAGGGRHLDEPPGMVKLVDRGGVAQRRKAVADIGLNTASG